MSTGLTGMRWSGNGQEEEEEGHARGRERRHLLCERERQGELPVRPRAATESRLLTTDSPTPQNPVQQYPLSTLTDLTTEKSKHLHLTFPTAGELHFVIDRKSVV